MTVPQIQLCLVLHNHQPVGNFEDVFEAAYQDSYLPFLDVFEPFEELSISLHTSGPLMKWLDDRHPEYLDRIAQLVTTGRVEIVGGAFYEPILTMVPSRDRIGQITRYSDWLRTRFQAKIGGMWIPERVWESALASDISVADIHYTVLDDYHFKRAGLTGDELNGYYVVEEEGRILRVFPGSEQLRYLIPFAEPSATIDYCRQTAESSPGSVLVFGDDGEKFGTWPQTKEHVYAEGWLQKFFQALVDNREWLKTSTLREAIESTSPRGKIFLPDASYREMTEWARPVDRQIEFDQLVHDMEHDPHWPKIQSFIGGGFWRNFKIKYEETNHMYSRMMFVSQMLQQAEQEGVDQESLNTARDHLYQGQCNCAYWHGAFGGIYLPHLRNAIYGQLINADNVLQKALRKERGQSSEWVEATADDYDFDGRPEIRLANENIVAWVSAHNGGHIYEFDLSSIGHNLGATMQRRSEVYHNKIREGQKEDNEETSSIHDRVIFKQEGLEERLQYDHRLRTCLIDHFWDEAVEVQAIADNTAMERGDFADGPYQAKIRRNPGRVQILMTRLGNAWGIPLTITKGLTLNQGGDQIEIAYMIEGLPQDRDFHFGVEFNFAGLPDGLDDRFYSDSDGKRLGQLGATIDLPDCHQLNVTDDWLGLEIGMRTEQQGGFWAFPVQSVSQSESGFELVHQAISVHPHWLVRGDRNGRWATRLDLSLATRSSDNQEIHNRMVATR